MTAGPEDRPVRQDLQHVPAGACGHRGAVHLVRHSPASGHHAAFHGAEIHGTLATIVGINQSTYIQEDFASIVDINALVLRENPEIQYLVTSRRGGTVP